MPVVWYLVWKLKLEMRHGKDALVATIGRLLFTPMKRFISSNGKGYNCGHFHRLAVSIVSRKRVEYQFYRFTGGGGQHYDSVGTQKIRGMKVVKRRVKIVEPASDSRLRDEKLFS